jgi:hypothetical protein
MPLLACRAGNEMLERPTGPLHRRLQLRWSAPALLQAALYFPDELAKLLGQRSVGQAGQPWRLGRRRPNGQSDLEPNGRSNVGRASLFSCRTNSARPFVAQQVPREADITFVYAIDASSRDLGSRSVEEACFLPEPIPPRPLARDTITVRVEVVRIARLPSVQRSDSSSPSGRTIAEGTHACGLRGGG